MHELEGPNCTICSLNPRKFTKPLKAWDGKVEGQMETLRLVSLELEATGKGGTSTKTYEDLFFPLPSGGKRKPYLTPNVVAAIRKFSAGIGRDRIGSYGFEICTAPASGTKFVSQCNTWEEAFKEDCISTNEGHGMHVHTDARDFCAKELHKLMMAYRSIQPALFKMVPTHRRRSIEDGGPCARIRYTPQVVASLLALEGPKMIQEFLKSRTLPHISGTSDNLNPFTADRHVGCNIALSFALHNTVEWRLPPGCTKAADMIGWARMFAKIMDWVVDELDLAEAQRLVKKGWNGRSSTIQLKRALDSERCSEFIAKKQREFTK